MVTNERKQETCNKYREYLRVINIIGNKIILQKHLMAISINLGIVKDEFAFIRDIRELEKNEIIKKIDYRSTKNKFILLRKYAIRYLANAKKSSDVASITRVNSNKRYDENIMKVQFIIDTIIPSIIRREIEVNLDNMLVFLENLNCNILHKANNMSTFYNLLIKNKIITDEILNDLKSLEIEQDTRVSNLKGTENKCRNYYRKNKEDYIYNSNIATLARKSIYIGSIKIINSIFKIKAYYFNISEEKNTRIIALNYSITYNTFKRLLGSNIELEFIVIVKNSMIRKILIEDLNKKGINPRTKEMRTENYLIEMLRGNGLNEIDFQKIKIRISTYIKK